MKKTTRILAVAGLIAVGALGVAGVQAFGAPKPSLPTIAPAVAAPSTTPVASTSTSSVDPALQSKISAMLQTRMGLSAAEADKLAATMAQRMQSVHGSQAINMVNACAALGDASGNTTGSTRYGMMGGSYGGAGTNSGGFGSGMMGGGL